MGGKAMDEAVITIRLTEAEASRVEQATAEVPYLLSHAGNVFQLLWSLDASGFAQGETGISSVLELCSRALATAAEKEGEAISFLDSKLRDAIKARREEERAEQLEAQRRLNGATAAVFASGKLNCKPDDKGV